MTLVTLALPGEAAGDPTALLPADLTAVTIHLDDREQFFYQFIWGETAPETGGGLRPEFAIDIIREALNLGEAERMAEICGIEFAWHQPREDGQWTLTLYLPADGQAVRLACKHDIDISEPGGDYARYVKADLARQLDFEDLVGAALGPPVRPRMPRSAEG